MEYEKNNFLLRQQNGYFLNLSLTNDPKAVPWAHVIGHPLYPEIGIYEGGYIYDTGVWRSTENSIMNIDKNGYFNTVCRELIVKRILTLAGEEYTFEKFLEKDVLSEQPSYNTEHTCADIQFVHHPPIFLDNN